MRWTLPPNALDRLVAHVRALAEKQHVAQDLIPTVEELRALIDAAFWATLLPEEGRYPTFSLLFCPPDRCATTFRCEPMLVTAEAIRGLAPALRPQITRLGIARAEAGRLMIWGVVADRTSDLEIRGIAPGRVVVQLDWENLAIVSGQGAETLLQVDTDTGERHGLGRPQAAALFAAQFGATQDARRRVVMGIILLMVAEAMRSHGNGGTIIVVPKADSPVVNALKLGRYAGNTGDLLALLLEHYVERLPEGRNPIDVIAHDKRFSDLDSYLRGRLSLVHPDVRAATEAVGQLSAIDGAVVLTEDLHVLSFGTTITQPVGTRDEIDRRPITAWESGGLVPIATLGGTRKQSAARLVANNPPDPVVLVASHDGPLVASAWGLGHPGGPVPLWVTGLETLLD